MKRRPLILISLRLAAFAINHDTTIVNVAAGIAVAGVVMALALPPTQPTSTSDDTPELPALAAPATAAGRG